MTDYPKGFTQIGQRLFEWGARTYVMGVLNITPDSFSGDGVGDDVQSAVDQAVRFQEWGADIVDIGGESTRPASFYSGVEEVSAREELARVLPVIEAVASSVDIPVSIDTYKSTVAREAIRYGASMVNDVWGLTRDPAMASVVADAEVPVVLMHNQTHTRYQEVVSDVSASLRGLAEAAIRAGIPADHIVADPGIGFGKTALHNIEILRRLGELRGLAMPLLVGTSRKSMIGEVLGLPVDERVEGTAATVAISIANGADMVRVHDVREMVRVARMTDAIVRGWQPESA